MQILTYTVGKNRKGLSLFPETVLNILWNDSLNWSFYTIDVLFKWFYFDIQIHLWNENNKFNFLRLIVWQFPNLHLRT